MEKLISSGVGKTLAKLVADGKATVEDFDTPSRGYLETEKSRVKSMLPCDYTNPHQKVPSFNDAGESYDTFPKPTISYPPAPPFRNLCREWIEANRQEWLAISGQVLEKVEASPSPKDLAA